MNRRSIIISAPSGSGKTTIIRRLLACGLPLAFSVSATSRAPRAGEKDGTEYYFMSSETFREKIAAEEFVEYEEVYANVFYGTLKSEIDRIAAAGKHVLFDVDVTGGLRLKKCYGTQALAIFIRPPSVDELRRRLESRATDAPDVIARRLDKAQYELSFATRFDAVVLNDELQRAQDETCRLVTQFLGL
ncbi:MAG: guanylate kinase [Tannerella sp.]|jgi:guanylate kinase|nr:guanylate kinase [Tannerella sp.]